MLNMHTYTALNVGIFVGSAVVFSFALWLLRSQATIHSRNYHGIGFIGGGGILKDQDKVAGMASGASICDTGAIGLMIAFDRT